MPSIDFSTLSAKARANYIRIGRSFGSTDTLAQANQTLNGLATHGTALEEHGFAEEDRDRLLGARDGLIGAGVGREGARGDKKVTAASYWDAVKSGKALRKSARTILQTTRRALHDKGDAASEAGVTRIDAALQQSRSLDDEDKLPGQLDVLRGALADGSVAPAATKRGGPKAVADLQATADAIRSAAADRSKAAGTPAETEHLDLLDGIVVTLARDAHQAAVAAAKRLGMPALVADFELTKLYPARRAVPQPVGPAVPTNGDEQPKNP